MTQFDQLAQDPEFIDLQKKYLKLVEKHQAGLRAVKGAEAGHLETYRAAIKALSDFRGRDLFYPSLSSGLGRGAYVEGLDGSVRLDMIAGIGVQFFGHSFAPFMEEGLIGAVSDTMQGGLQPGPESTEFFNVVFRLAKAEGIPVEQGWLTCSGTMANENALKIIRQKKCPGFRMFAFEHSFAGRSHMMAELTDQPKYREGLPTHGEVVHLPFFRVDDSLESNISRTRGRIDDELARFPGTYAGLVFEPIQGEGGFLSAPREYLRTILSYVKSKGLCVWADEVQSFGRTGNAFGVKTVGVEDLVDVITIGKLSQACAVLFTREMNPRPGLVAGTFSGSVSAIRCGARGLKYLEEGGYFGPKGKIQKLSSAFRFRLESLSKRVPGAIGELRIFGGMVGFVPYDGSADAVKKVITGAFDRGLILFSAGHGPNIIRMLPPLAVMEEKTIDEVCDILEETLKSISHGETAK